MKASVRFMRAPAGDSAAARSARAGRIAGRIAAAGRASRRAWPLALGVLLLLASFAPSFAQVTAKEDEVVKLIAQADDLFAKAEYKLAIGSYLEAQALAASPANQYKAAFGLARSYYALKDQANAVKWMRRAADVDPVTPVSEQAYPKPFAQLFNQVLKERRERLAREAAQPEAVPAKAAGEEKKPPERVVEAPPPAAKPPDLAGLGLAGPEPGLSGRFELGVHFGTWGIDLLKGIFEGPLNDKLGEEIRDEVRKQSARYTAGLVPAGYVQDLTFDSSGSTYGLELRYYTLGRAGTFSLGVSIDKTRMTLAVSGQVRQDFTNGATASADATGTVETAPFSTSVDFRWEIGRTRVRPYIAFGLGLAPLKGTVSYEYVGTYSFGGFQEPISDSQAKTFEEIAVENEFDIPKSLILFRLGLGVKAEVVPGLSVLGEASIWDGLQLRAGLAYRF